jgi:hypothetical protein
VEDWCLESAAEQGGGLGEWALKHYFISCLQGLSPFRPLKGKPKPNTNTGHVVKTVFGCFALVSPLGDGRGWLLMCIKDTTEDCHSLFSN